MKLDYLMCGGKPFSFRKKKAKNGAMDDAVTLKEQRCIYA